MLAPWIRAFDASEHTSPMFLPSTYLLLTIPIVFASRQGRERAEAWLLERSIVSLRGFGDQIDLCCAGDDESAPTLAMRMGALRCVALV